MKIEELYYDLSVNSVKEEDFDLEKWREDNPIDYFKAIYMLQQSGTALEKTIAFKTLYNVFRLYIPDTLYKYCSLSNNEELNEQKLKTLEKSKIYMANPKEFNDPFDGIGFFYDSKQLMDIERLKPHRGKMIDDFNSFVRATSLTSNNVKSLPMWAHYGGNHTGYCVSYDTNNNPIMRSCTFKVQYISERLDITSLMREQAIKLCNEIEKHKTDKTIIYDDLTLVFISSLLCNLKHKSWSYENEFRCTIGVETNGTSYITAIPREIYIGMNCSDRNTNRLIEIAKKINVPVYRMYFDECNPNFDIVAQKII